ncbi:MAG TPA: hypothetical protein VLN57_18175 [Xanthobacteraceae bacterium]|nr:hypothetical protein [Xanthobacteraceae bacterium]
MTASKRKRGANFASIRDAAHTITQLSLQLCSRQSAGRDLLSDGVVASRACHPALIAARSFRGAFRIAHQRRQGTMSNEPGAAVLSLFDTLINNVKQARPVRSDNKPLGGGVVYSMMTLGMPVDPEDYLHPWSPMGGASAQGQAQATSATPVSPPTAPAAGAAQPATPPDPKYAKALEAAYKTAQLCNIMLQVTTDGTYLEYPTGRHLDAAYEGVITGMQPLPMPPISPAVQKQIDDAQKVLYELDPDDGSIVGKSKLYKRYSKNAAAYAQAKADYAVAMAASKSDPAKAEIWPMTSATYQQNVDDAYDTLKTEGAEKVERALDIIGSVGVSVQDHMIKKARQLFDTYGRKSSPSSAISCRLALRSMIQRCRSRRTTKARSPPTACRPPRSDPRGGRAGRPAIGVSRHAGAHREPDGEGLRPVLRSLRVAVGRRLLTGLRDRCADHARHVPPPSAGSRRAPAGTIECTDKPSVLPGVSDRAPVRNRQFGSRSHRRQRAAFDTHRRRDGRASAHAIHAGYGGRHGNAGRGQRSGCESFRPQARIAGGPIPVPPGLRDARQLV